MVIIIIILSILLIVACLFAGIAFNRAKKLQEKHAADIHLYQGILDAIPFPLSVTDKDMNWIFINKPVEKMLNTTRKDCLGKHCSNWGAGICKTDNCGVTCLRKGKNQTLFSQGGYEFKVDVGYLYDLKGDISGHIEVVQDITEMTSMIKTQENLIKDADSVCEILIKEAEVSNSNAQKLSLGTNEQMAAVEEMIATVNEIASQTKNNSERLTVTTENIKQSVKELENSNQQMDSLIDAMAKVNATSEEISMVITSIEAIASQTNLLSLNASIEAARAGESGRGFAVVAEQIGELASQSANAAKNTKVLIDTALDAIRSGNEITDKTANSLHLVVDSISEVRQSSVEINDAISAQAEAIEQVNIALDQVSSVIQENAVIATESFETSNQVSTQTKRLNEIISRK